MTEGLSFRAPGRDRPAIEVLSDTFKSLSRNASSSSRPFKTEEDFKEALMTWLKSQPLVPNDVYSAIMEYVCEVIRLTTLIGVDKGYKYHLECQRAATRTPHSLFNPLIHGPTYWPAYDKYVKPYLSRDTHSQSSKSTNKASTSTAKSYKSGRAKSSSARRRPASPASSGDESKMCTLHKGSNHTDAECLSQKGNQAAKKRKT